MSGATIGTPASAPLSQRARLRVGLGSRRLSAGRSSCNRRRARGARLPAAVGAGRSRRAHGHRPGGAVALASIWCRAGARTRTAGPVNDTSGPWAAGRRSASGSANRPRAAPWNWSSSAPAAPAARREVIRVAVNGHELGRSHWPMNWQSTGCRFPVTGSRRAKTCSPWLLPSADPPDPPASAKTSAPGRRLQADRVHPRGHCRRFRPCRQREPLAPLAICSSRNILSVNSGCCVRLFSSHSNTTGEKHEQTFGQQIVHDGAGRRPGVAHRGDGPGGAAGRRRLFLQDAHRPEQPSQPDEEFSGR